MMFGFRDEFRYIECASCGCLQISEVPPNLAKYYPDDYYSYSPRKNRSPGWLQTSLKRCRAGYQLKDQGGIRRVLSFIDPPREYFGWLRRAGVGFQSRILDVGCGTSRLLLPYRRAGLDVDGCDISQDMLALCHQTAKREGLFVNLYEQAMHELDLPRAYKTIVVTGAFELSGDRRQALDALRRFYHHWSPQAPWR